MNINELHKRIGAGDPEAEERLFESLSARFRMFARQRVKDKEDAEEIVQDALTTIVQKYRGIEFETSFAAWAHKVLEYKILDHFRARGRQADRRAELTLSLIHI